MDKQDKKKLEELEEEIRKLKKQTRRQKWLSVFLLWNNK